MELLEDTRQQGWRLIFQVLWHTAEPGFGLRAVRQRLGCSGLDVAQLGSQVTLDDVFFPSHNPELLSTAPAQLSRSVLALAGVRSPPGLPVSQALGVGWAQPGTGGLSMRHTVCIHEGLLPGEVHKGLVQGSR